MQCFCVKGCSKTGGTLNIKLLNLPLSNVSLESTALNGIKFRSHHEKNVHRSLFEQTNMNFDRGIKHLYGQIQIKKTLSLNLNLQ